MRRALWVLVAAVIVLLGMGIYVSLGPKLPIEVPFAKGCRAQTDAGTVHLYPEQMANAATIAAVGVVNGVPERGVVIALATAMQESSLRNLDHGHLDSVGLFQQRPSQGWGSVEEISNPRYAAARFYEHLLQVDGWESLRVTEAAQAVQRSAYEEAYQKWADDAEVLSDALLGAHPTSITCVKVSEPTLRGQAAAEALAEGLRADWGAVASMVAATGAQRLSVVAGHDQAGWRLAHWLVAHSADRNVSRVRFDDHEWSVESGEWSHVEAPPADTLHVVIADVYPA